MKIGNENTVPSRAKAGKARAGAYFLDANILMYAAGAQHPLREPCRAALHCAVNRDSALITDSEVLQEILYRYFSVQKPDVAQSVYRAAVDLCMQILPVAESHTARALALLLRHPRITARDAIHIATMEASGIHRILSTDTHFDAFAGIQRIDPADFVA